MADPDPLNLNDETRPEPDDDFVAQLRRDYAHDPVTLAEILAIEAGESTGDNRAVADDHILSSDDDD